MWPAPPPLRPLRFRGRHHLRSAARGLQCYDFHYSEARIHVGDLDALPRLLTPDATLGTISAARGLQMLRVPLFGSSDPCWGPRCSPALAGPRYHAGYYFGCQRAPDATTSIIRKLGSMLGTSMLSGPRYYAGYYFGCQSPPNATISTGRKLGSMLGTSVLSRACWPRILRWVLFRLPEGSKCYDFH